LIAGDVGEDVRPIPVVAKVRIGGGRIRVPGRVAQIDLDQRFEPGAGFRSEEKGVDRTEDGRVEADAEGERKDGDRCESWTSRAS
jgi:hypothetical protein